MNAIKGLGKMNRTPQKSRQGRTHGRIGQRHGILLIILAILLAACDGEAFGRGTVVEGPTAAVEESAADPEETPTTIATSGTTILAEGELVAVEPQLQLGFATSGRLLDIYVQAGDTVAAGELIATLDDQALQEALVDAQLGVQQAENNLAQAQLSLDELLNWAPEEGAVAQAEASLAAAEASLGKALSQDSAAANSVTSARISLEQAERGLAEAQDAYTQAFDPGREWELYIDDPSCRTGEQYPNCTGPPYSDKIEQERDAAENAIRGAEDNLAIARANYNLAIAGLNDNSAVDAEAAIANAQQALGQALSGPGAEEISAARLQVEAAELSRQQAEINLEKATNALADSELFAPGAGTVLTVDSTPGSFVTSGTPIITLLDTSRLQFQTNNLSERDLAQIKPGQPVTLTLKAYPNDPLPGHVARIAPLAAGTIGDAATFTVMIDLEETDLNLLPGMTGRVEIANR